MNNTSENTDNQQTFNFDIEEGRAQVLRDAQASLNDVYTSLRVCLTDSRERVIQVGSGCCFLTLGAVVLLLYGLGYYSDCPNNVSICNEVENADIKIGNTWLSHKECKSLSVPDVDKTNTQDAQYDILLPVHGKQIVDMPSGNLDVHLSGDITDYFHEKFDGYCTYGIYKNTIFGSRSGNEKNNNDDVVFNPYISR